MHGSKKYVCPACGKMHDCWPAIVFNSPACYSDLTKDEQESLGLLNPDFCQIHYPHQIDRFIRATLTQKVNDYCEDLEYGLWVTLSEKSFQDYQDNFENDHHKAQYFGWLSSRILRKYHRYSYYRSNKIGKSKARDCCP